MAFDANAFGAALLTQVAVGPGGITERVKEAKDYKEEKEDLAERNLPIFQKRTAQKDVLLGYARTLQNMGAKPEQIMYYLRLGPSQFQSLHKHITKKAADFKKATNGTELSEVAVQKMMDMPQEFEGTIQEQGFEEFLNKAYRLSAENDGFEAPVTEEISAGNLLKGMLGIGAKERVKQKLKTEKFLGNLSVDQINRVAAQQDFLDPYGGQDMPVLDLTTGPVILDYDTQERIKERATNKYNAATTSVKKVTPLIKSYMARNGITANTLQIDDAELASAEIRIAQALVNEDISGLESDEEINIYNEVRDRTKFDTFKEAAGGRVSGDTVKFFGAEVEELFDKFETKVGSSNTGADKGQGTTTADYNSYDEYLEAVDSGSLQPGTYTIKTPQGIKKTVLKPEELSDGINKDVQNTTVKEPSGEVLSQEAFDALPDDVGDPPGTMLSPSGRIRDLRNKWFEKYGDTHSTTGKKKTYMQYKNTVDPASSPNPYVQGDQYMTGG